MSSMPYTCPIKLHSKNVESHTNIHAIFITERALVLIMHDTLHIQAPTPPLKMWNSENRLDAINNYVTVIGDCSYVFISICQRIN